MTAAPMSGRHVMPAGVAIAQFCYNLSQYLSERIVDKTVLSTFCVSNNKFASNMIVVDLQTFQQGGASGNVTGVIYVELESGPFPEAGWSDFPVIILSWWAEALLQLETPKRREVLWRFMDGPQSLTLTKVTDAIGSPTFEHVESHLLEAAQRVVSHCEQHNMLSKDLETLKANVRRLNANQAVQRTGASRSDHIEIRPSVAAGSRR